MLSVEHLFLAGLGCDIAGGYLVSRGLLQPMPQLAASGGTWYAIERQQATYRVDDRIRGTVGLVSLVLGFALQATGYVLVLNRAPIHYGTVEALVGLAIAVALGVGVPLVEWRVRERFWRRRLLIRLARFDIEAGHGLRDKPVAHILRAFGEELGHPRLAGETSDAYCSRVWQVQAEALGGND